MPKNYIQDIDFGFTSAEAECTEDTALILKGQIDLNKAMHKALNERQFLFLGYKGTGKSSLGERLRLTAGNKYNRFVSLLSLGEFPFKDFSKIIPGDEINEAKLPTTWAWILLIYLLESFYRDNGKQHPTPDDVEKTIAGFREMGFSEEANPSDIIRTTAKKTFTISAKIAGAAYTPGELRLRRDIPDYVNSLKKFISKFRSESQHYIIIDGLDDILTNKEIQYQSLSALLKETQSLNQFFKQSSTPAKLILLCRTDVFDRLSMPNKNKLRDYTFEFDWYHDPRNPDKSALIQAAELRSSLKLPKNIKLFGDIFPSSFDRHGKDTQKQLLDLTRHTPRDFLQLLREIQSFSKSSGVTKDTILSGIRQYSSNYFIKEIRDELSGYSNPQHIEKIFEAFGKLREREFSFSKLKLQLQDSLGEEDLLNALDVLYNCSAIGNVERRGYNQNPFYSSKYQNRETKLNPDLNIILHKGLWKALNIS